MAEERTEAKQERQTTVPAPLVPARPSPFVLFVKTVNTLWGSDRILRTGQFLGRFIAGSPEVTLMLSPCMRGGAPVLNLGVCRDSWEAKPMRLA